ncbi:hypothetical protein M758_UG133900 [Ceratodon purpureus]|nr:hypothetical protein M758_UG133900 [Ceratodon purpureus]
MDSRGSSEKNSGGVYPHATSPSPPMENAVHLRGTPSSLQNSVFQPSANVNFPSGLAPHDASFMYHPFMFHMLNMYVGAMGGTDA